MLCMNRLLARRHMRQLCRVACMTELPPQAMFNCLWAPNQKFALKKVMWVLVLLTAVFTMQAGLREASTQLGDLGRNVSGLQGMFGGSKQGTGPLGDDMAQLAREVSSWIDAEGMPQRTLPYSASTDATASGSF